MINTIYISFVYYNNFQIISLRGSHVYKLILYDTYLPIYDMQNVKQKKW